MKAITTLASKGSRRWRKCRTCDPSVQGKDWIILIGNDRAFAVGTGGIHMAENLANARDWAMAHGANGIHYQQEPPGFIKNGTMMKEPLEME